MRSKYKIVFRTTSVIAAALLLFIFYCYLHNFYEVLPGQVYRSRQLSKQELIDVTHRYHIKSIINLRGAHPGLVWYQEEMAAANDEHIMHYDIALKSKTLPNPATLKDLTHLIASAPRPLLIHCQSGVDRTGLASAIALILANSSMDDVAKQVSIRYFVLSENSTGKQMLRQYNAWLIKQGKTTSRENFILWLKSL